jgi:hypothetical protein
MTSYSSYKNSIELQKNVSTELAKLTANSKNNDIDGVNKNVISLLGMP